MTNPLVSLLGGAAGIGFAMCGVPAARASWKIGAAVAPKSTAWLIFGSGLAMYLYLFLTYGFNLLLTVNYFVEVVSWGVVLKYHYFPRRVKFDYDGGDGGEPIQLKKAA